MKEGSKGLSCQPSSSENDLLAIHLKKYGCLVEIKSDKPLTLNRVTILEKAFIKPGDFIQINDQVIRLIDENNLPVEGSTPFKLTENPSNSHHLFTSVTGVRSFNKETNGELELLGRDKNFVYKQENDTPFMINYVDRKLTLLCQKDHQVLLNGNSCNLSKLKNGDVINTRYSKFIIESPGSSAYSKYSPSHPRNMTLSEEYIDKEDKPEKNNEFWKENLWWISMVSGLVVIAIVLVMIKNST